MMRLTIHAADSDEAVLGVEAIRATQKDGSRSALMLFGDEHRSTHRVLVNETPAGFTARVQAISASTKDIEA